MKEFGLLSLEGSAGSRLLAAASIVVEVAAVGCANNWLIRLPPDRQSVCRGSRRHGVMEKGIINTDTMDERTEKEMLRGEKDWGGWW